MSYPSNSGTWTTGLCGCFEHCSSCCLGWCCPCVLVGRTVEIIDQGATSCTSGCCVFYLLAHVGAACFYTCGYRGRLRAKFGLPEAPCGDCLTDYCCLACSICQVYRELLNRNIDPALGYANVKQVYDQSAPAPGQQFMSK